MKLNNKLPLFLTLKCIYLLIYVFIYLFAITTLKLMGKSALCLGDLSRGK